MIASICNSSKVEHLHAHFGTASTVAMMAADMANISFSFTTHAKDIYKNDVDHNHLELKIKKSRFIITVSDYNKSFLDKKFKTCDNKIIRLYNGIDLNKFKKENERISDNTILSVGRLEKKKGFKYLIESCNALKNKEIDFKCLIVGEGQERKNLELLIKEYGLSRQVKLLGSKTQEEITELLNNSRVFVLPSIIDEFGDRDVLPTVLIEAMAMRVPVISTSISAIPEIIENNKSGILIKQKDPDKLAVCLQRLLSNEQLQKKYSENGRKRVKRLFDIEKNIPKLARLFERYTIKRKKRIAV
ncbi:MAG: glycosyltransferase [Nitrosopumilaceae archaeon]|nr:glycosyltransferase [Nitrosopumilaceae archaeon]